MSWLRLSPFAEFLEHRRPGCPTLQGVCHRLTGFSFEVHPQFGDLLTALRDSSIEERELRAASPEARHTFQVLRDAHILVPGTDCDTLLRPFLEWRLTTPAMNPALLWRDQEGEYKLTRLPDAHISRLPRSSARPEPLTEDVPETCWRLFTLAEQGKTLRAAMREFPPGEVGIVNRSPLWKALNFLSHQQRQMIRLAAPEVAVTPARHPVHYLNQSFHYSHQPRSGSDSAISGRAFYQEDIGDAGWNFDWVEPTVCHAFRFPSEAFAMQSYGERFCDSVVSEAGITLDKNIRILEIGGGTGSLACGFLKRTRERFGPVRVDYTILDCSERLAAKQRASLREAGFEVRHILQDAENLSIPGEQFDLVISNEMIADLSVAPAAVDGAQPGHNWTYTGVGSLIGRLRTHVRPGASIFLTEYGEKTGGGSVQDHLNHHECSIDFETVARFAENNGFEVRVSGMVDFLQPQNQVEMLCGGQDQLLCLNAVMAQRDRQVPFAAFSRSQFKTNYGDLVGELQIRGHSFAPMHAGLHYGPDLAQFYVAHLKISQH